MSRSRIPSVLDELISGRMSLRIQLKDRYDKFKDGRRKLAHAIKDILLDLDRLGLDYGRKFLTDPYAYRFTDKIHARGSACEAAIRLNYRLACEDTYRRFKDIVLHENLHLLNRKNRDASNLTSRGVKLLKLLKKQTEGRNSALEEFEECMYTLENRNISHNLSFFRLCKETGVDMPDVYFKCRRCSNEKSLQLFACGKKEDLDTGYLSPSQIDDVWKSGDDTPVTCSHCGDVFEANDTVLSDSVIFVNLDSLYHKSARELALSALQHPYTGNPEIIVIKYKGRMMRFANHMFNAGTSRNLV